uniref:F-box/LRR-repeat protein 4 n=1 Tax=Cajanus cajan TaxID=3821 RepID=A0A151RJU1_CAJCA|nr:F-box/LRR-repeat protein 4 [Cajanus cajan]
MSECSEDSIELHLPDECWELIFKTLKSHRHFQPLSLLSKQCLSITNRLRTSLTVTPQTLPTLPRLLLRFPSLTTLHITRLPHAHLHALLLHLSRSALPLRSLSLSAHPSIPSDGFRYLSQKTPPLKSLTCSHIASLTNSDLSLIKDYFPFLEHLDLSFPDNSSDPVSDSAVEALSLGLPNLRRVNLSGNFFIHDPSILSLCKNCQFLEELVIFECHFITQRGIASAIRERPCVSSLCVSNFGCGAKKGDFFRPHVTSDFIEALVGLKGLTCLDLSFSSISDELLCCVAEEGIPLRKLVLQGCCNYSYVGVLCLLSTCRFVEHLDLQNAEFLCDQRVEELCAFLGNLVYIDVSGCRMVTDSALLALARNCPFLEVLDLSSCCGVYEGVVEVLRRCTEVRHLSLAFCSGVRLTGLNFEVRKLEELNLSRSGIDDEALSVISKCCRWLLQLDLENCSRVTAKGVRQMVENCTQLREISLVSCYEVEASIVAWMVFSRPSLRRIMAPPRFDLSDGQRELFLRHGCLVC